eukprot:TRINITY_DN74639_c0_g1_i1.p1 TRINITY_DN74639_c0_g1~~TRINITY_DN74639_c0_g1_i1.p1  ORF type:complete len:661 (-),score=168.10 TRINITY_DN74639_c0_g1_i1:71-2053(-)
MTTAAFFSHLPRNQLSSLEMQLQQHLCAAAVVADQLFPASGSVSLQEWAEHRIPGQLTLRANSQGKVVLSLSKNGAAKAPDAPLPPPPNMTPPPSDPAAPNRQVPKPPPPASRPVQDKEAFFAGLPGDCFTAEEQKLREALTQCLSRGPLLLGKASQSVQQHLYRLLPQGSAVSLGEWIERRIGEEVIIQADSNGKSMCKLADSVAAAAAAEAPPPVETGSAGGTQAFLDRLPGDAFLPEEEALRSSMFDFLAKWTSKDLATLSNMIVDSAVSKACNKFIPKTVDLKDWIERRIGKEIELKKDSRGQFVIHLTERAHTHVMERLTKGGSGGASSSSARKVRGNDWFARLPEDSFLPAEDALREALLDFFAALPARGRGGSRVASLPDALKVRAVKKEKESLLPQGTKLEDWIERRIGAEVLCSKSMGGMVTLEFVGDPQDLEGRGGSMSSELAGFTHEEVEMDPEEERDTEPAGAERRQRDGQASKLLKAFLDNLNSHDGFTPVETELRQALLDFIETFEDPNGNPPTVWHAASDPQVKKARFQLLPRGSGVKLRDWIEHRIGEEVECVNIPGTDQVALGMAGTLDINNLTGGGPPAKRSRMEDGSAAGRRDDRGAGSGNHRRHRRPGRMRSPGRRGGRRREVGRPTGARSPGRRRRRRG